MFRLLILLIVLLSSPLGTALAGSPESAFDWDAWRSLPVLDGGRPKPMDTLVWETARILSNRVHFVDPKSNEELGATALYLSMLFDWQGWGEVPNPHGSPAARQNPYYEYHKPDHWDNAPLLRVDFLALREALGLAADQKYVSPVSLDTAQITLPDSEQPAPFVAWAERLGSSQQADLSLFQRKALDLFGKYRMYQAHRMGRRLFVLPVKNSAEEKWVSVAELTQTRFSDRLDPTGELRQLQKEINAARQAYLDGNAEEFNRASVTFIDAVRQLGPQQGHYPDQATIDLEIDYNHWAPFRIAWILMAVTFVTLLLYMGSKWRLFYGISMTGFILAMVVMLVGFGMRLSISGRAPVTNMYESVAYVAFGAALFGLILELVYRRQFALTAAAAVATIALILADNCPAVLDPSIQPLQPVLKSNFWLVTHVMTITLSYATFALAMAFGNITLGCFLVGSRNQQTISELSRFNYKTLQVGVFLLTVGTILGAVWADYSWGRFWGWDPKEVWALIALLGYLAVLHARYVGWVHNFGLAALSAVCFALVVMAWYGVNFVLGAGLHSYGFGAGGEQYVYAVVGAQFLFVLIAMARHCFSRVRCADRS